jgi:hypothetical protein
VINPQHEAAKQALANVGNEERIVVAPAGSLEAMERYLKLMQDQGQKPVWSDQRLAELRTKAAKQ